MTTNVSRSPRLVALMVAAIGLATSTCVSEAPHVDVVGSERTTGGTSSLDQPSAPRAATTGSDPVVVAGDVTIPRPVPCVPTRGHSCPLPSGNEGYCPPHCVNVDPTPIPPRPRPGPD